MVIWKNVKSGQEFGKPSAKGLPYIFFTDNVNRNKPQVYKD
jgi:hypothetical protein